MGGLVAQAVRRSPPTAGDPSSRLGHSMWVSWWTKRGLGRFFSGFLPFSPTTNFFSPHSSHPFRFISPALVMVRQAWSAGILATHGPILWGFTHLIPRPNLVLETGWGYLFIYFTWKDKRRVRNCEQVAEIGTMIPKNLDQSQHEHVNIWQPFYALP